VPNPDYKANRKQIEKDLKPSLDPSGIKVYPVSISSSPVRIIENFQDSGYFLALDNDGLEAQARLDPVGWLRGHPYLCESYPEFFVDVPRENKPSKETNDLKST
jgi:hypothetical protein